MEINSVDIIQSILKVFSKKRALRSVTLSDFYTV